MVNSSFGQVLLVGLGGFLGSSARFLLSGMVDRLVVAGTFPYGTLTVNALGCLVIGFLGAVLESRELLGSGQRIFLLVGVLGGFTTFSTFTYETLTLVHGSDLPRAALNVGLHVLIGLLAVWGGYQSARYL